jgi:hypothetical protein
MNLRNTIWTAVAAFACTAMAWGQQIPRPQPDEPPDTVVTGFPVKSAAADSLRPSNVMGSDLILKDGQVVGQIKDFVIGSDQRVDFAIGLRNATGEYFPIPFSAISLNPYHQVPLPLTSSQFLRLPFFTTDAWPNFHAPVFREQILAVYGSSGIGPAPNKNFPMVSGTVMRERAKLAQDPYPDGPIGTTFPINNRIPSYTLTSGLRAPASPPLPPDLATRLPAPYPMPSQITARPNAPDAAPASPGHVVPRSITGPALRAKGVSEYLEFSPRSGATGGTGGSSDTSGSNVPDDVGP